MRKGFRQTKSETKREMLRKIENSRRMQNTLVCLIAQLGGQVTLSPEFYHVARDANLVASQTPLGLHLKLVDDDGEPLLGEGSTSTPGAVGGSYDSVG